MAGTEAKRRAVMRTVSYFLGGTVADFAIPDDQFDAFAAKAKWEVRHVNEELLKARKVLERFVAAGTGQAAGPGEILAASFIWNFFNGHPDEALHIEGDVIVVDLDGTGETVEYASIKDINLAPAD